MMREFTCIICPNGCEIRAEIEEKEGGAVEILSIEGAACKKGNAYVEQELKDPQRNIATSVLVKGGILPLTSVRLTAPIRKCSLTAPVESGTVVIHNLLGYDTDVIVTKDIPENAEK